MICYPRLDPTRTAPKACGGLERAGRELMFCSCSLPVPGEEVWGHGWHPRGRWAQSGLCLLATCLVLPIAGVTSPLASPLPGFLHQRFLERCDFPCVPGEHPAFAGLHLALRAEGFAAGVKQLKQNDPAAPC